MNSATVLALLAVGTYALRLAGPVFHRRLHLSERTTRLLGALATVLLAALAATAALTQGHHLADWERPGGVLIGVTLAARRMPLPVVVIGTAATTALLRLLFVP
ncbi:AzlD domain-containing protein [Catenulispora pinisilvae]|uniref:AzlD domain-containing protein n=1 Tax=Catenulispora pinisilvae TaxID=2705253 RepID=UPI001890B889|nr:AzlD domain-containing protein [Catenulispora pinisilvae]